MLTITGKSLITTDWHFGLKGNSESRMRILCTVTKNVSRHMKENGIRNFIFCGDLYNSRANLAVNTINIAIKCMEAISRNCEHVYLILGNHDIFNKNSVEINSVNMFKHIKNVTIIRESTECDINGKRCLFVPWLGSLSYEKSSFDMIFGHFDINSRFLINSFIEDNMRKNATKEELRKLIQTDELLSDSGLDDLDEIIENTEETYLHREKSSDLIGDWIEIVKEKGTIFAGHIHGHKEFYAKSRKFIFVGSPYQQTRGEMRSTDGFYVMKEDGTYEFHEITDTPKFIDLRISDIARNIDGFDYGIVTGNIIHRIYDVEVDRITDSRITQNINGSRPFEETSPDYLVSSPETGNSMESVDIIKRSKLDYLHLYISNIDEKVLKDNNIDRNRLDSVMTEYYNQVISE